LLRLDSALQVLLGLPVGEVGDDKLCLDLLSRHGSPALLAELLKHLRLEGINLGDACLDWAATLGGPARKVGRPLRVCQGQEAVLK
jgi:hypothetical protein